MSAATLYVVAVFFFDGRLSHVTLPAMERARCLDVVDEANLRAARLNIPARGECVEAHVVGGNAR